MQDSGLDDLVISRRWWAVGGIYSAGARGEIERKGGIGWDVGWQAGSIGLRSSSAGVGGGRFRVKKNVVGGWLWVFPIHGVCIKSFHNSTVGFREWREEAAT